jgi:hypothetical protein
MNRRYFQFKARAASTGRTGGTRRRKMKKIGEAIKIDYDKVLKNLKPGEFAYGWSKQRLQLYDLTDAINHVILHVELLKRKHKLNPRSRHLRIITDSIAVARDLTIDIGRQDSTPLPEVWGHVYRKRVGVKAKLRETGSSGAANAKTGHSGM